MSLELLFDMIEDILGNVFGGRFPFHKIGEVVQERVIQVFQNPFYLLLQDTKIDDDPLLGQPAGRHRDLHLPVVAMKRFAFPVKVAEAVGP
jgi:hypothetical protein